MVAARWARTAHITAKPQAIKLFPVFRRLRDDGSADVTVCAAGQHRQLLDQVFALAGIAPDIDLNAMTANQTLDGLLAPASAAIASPWSPGSSSTPRPISRV